MRFFILAISIFSLYCNNMCLAYSDSDMEFLLTPDTSWKNSNVKMPTYGSLNSNYYGNSRNDSNAWLQQSNNYYQQQEQQRQIEELRRQQENLDYYRRQQDVNNNYRQLNRKMF